MEVKGYERSKTVVEMVQVEKKVPVPYIGIHLTTAEAKQFFTWLTVKAHPFNPNTLDLAWTIREGLGKELNET